MAKLNLTDKEILEIEQCALQYRQEALDRDVGFDEDIIKINNDINIGNNVLKYINSKHYDKNIKLKK